VSVSQGQLRESGSSKQLLERKEEKGVEGYSMKEMKGRCEIDRKGMRKQ
jgi:hypothetical protein